MELNITIVSRDCAYNLNNSLCAIKGSFWMESTLKLGRSDFLVIRMTLFHEVLRVSELESDSLLTFPSLNSK